MNSPVQHGNVAILSIEVDCVSIILLLQNSTTQWTNSFEHWVSCILEIFHHLWSTKIPFATAIGFISLSVNFEAYSLIFLDVRAQESSIPLFSWTMSLNMDMKIIRSLNFFRCDVLSLQRFLNFVEKVQCCGSWENLPLEVSRSPSNPCNSLKVWHILQSWHLITPSFDCIFWTEHFPQA